MRVLPLWVVVGLIGCAHAPALPPAALQESPPPAVEAPPPGPVEVVAPTPSAPTPRERIVAAARSWLGRAFRGDCSGFVKRALREAEVDFTLGSGRTGSESLYRGARAVRVPKPGDIAVFHDTYDRNRDGRWNDRFSHVALVETVEGSRVALIHRGGRGIARIWMNLDRPADPRENSIVRRGAARAGRKRLSGELFAGYASLLPPDEPLDRAPRASPAASAAPPNVPEEAPSTAEGRGPALPPAEPPPSRPSARAPSLERVRPLSSGASAEASPDELHPEAMAGEEQQPGEPVDESYDDVSGEGLSGEPLGESFDDASAEDLPSETLDESPDADL